ncbi:MAG: pyridoxal phosphate-dependent aminotransferase [Treponema sp.]|jgi:aspartate aminotransferase|nr:pyridoxal phosphate-dependent aminotransferase [Treponema sp.]
MPIAAAVKNSLFSSSMIRKMFEEGIQLKKLYGADKVFDFSLGNPDVDPPEAFHNVLVKLATEDEKGSHGYMPNAGFPFVREALAKKISREQNVEVDASHVIMAAGAAGGLNTVFKAICNPGDEVIVSRPFFMEYRAYAANNQVKLVEVDAAEDFNLDLNAIEAALSEKTAAVLINSPNNPTGKVYPASLLAGLSSLLAGHGKKTGRFPYLVSDEPYREIAYNVDVPPFLCCYNESIVVSSYSKNLSLPGERIGYIAVNPAISGKDDVVNGLIYCARVLGFVNAPALMQRIVAALTEASVDVSVYAKRRDAFMKVLDEAGIPYVIPEGAFYMFCKVPAKKDGEKGTDAEFVEHLKKSLILGVPGTGFAKPDWLRFAYCVDEKIINASADAFKQAMEGW